MNSPAIASFYGKKSEILAIRQSDRRHLPRGIGGFPHDDPQTGKSILYGSKVTALTKDLEMTGFGLTFCSWDGAIAPIPAMCR